MISHNDCSDTLSEKHKTLNMMCSMLTWYKNGGKYRKKCLFFLHLKEFWKDTHITVIMLVLVRTAWGKGGEQTEDSCRRETFSFY